MLIIIIFVRNFAVNCFLVIICAFVIVFENVLYKISAYTAIGKAKKIHMGKSEIESVLYFYEDRIKISEGDFSAAIYYDTVKRIMNMPKCYALVLS